MKLRLALAALVAALATVMVVAPVAPAAQPASSTSSLTVPVTQTIAGIGTFTGSYNITNFQVVNGVLTAVGTLSGTLTNTLGQVIGTVTNVPVTIPVTATPGGSCQILHLELGPLDLNLLGLMVHLDKVVLDITAQPGPGNLLGNLLCAVAHLLDNPSGTLTGVANLLNQILGNL